MTRRAAVIGAGWAGLAAAASLAAQGIEVTVFEASRTLGGRARRVEWTPASGGQVALDNGQHILIGAYRDTLSLLFRLDVDARAAFERTPLRLVGFDGLRLQATGQPAPWHLLAMLVTARGIGLDDRWSIAMFMQRARRIDWRLGTDVTVERLVADWKQSRAVVAKLWEPLCVAALNTPLAFASAQVFLNVLRDSFGARARDSDLLLPRVDLGALLPDATARLLKRKACPIRLGARVQNLHADADGVAIATGTATDVGAAERFDAAVVAVPPSETARLFAPMALRDVRYRTLVDDCERLAYQPIVTAYLRYRDPVRWRSRMMMLAPAPHAGTYGQWAFDRSDRLSDGGLVAAVISADGRHRDLEPPQLVDALARQLAVEAGLPSQPLESRVVIEKRATFACVPDLRRPNGSTPDGRLRLAGDHVAPDDRAGHYPATLETAVRSGLAAADALTERLTG